jgi:feruloyl esterase
MLKKSFLYFIVILGMFILFAGNSYAKHDSENWASIEYPEQNQSISYNLVKIVIQLEEGADVKSFKAKLNKKKISDRFDYDDYRNRLTATLGPEDGLNVEKKKGKNTLETEIKGAKKHKKKKDKDSLKFYVTGGPAPTCAELVSLDLPDVTIVTATDAEPDGSPLGYCHVAGVIETEIGFEVDLPVDWNGKFYMAGGGGMVGTISNQGAGDALARGYTTAGTDTGHTGTWYWADWALNNHERYVNFGYRAVHLTTLTAKDIIRIFYDNSIQYSYFSGCSTGGRQAMMESQRFPKDFDGIIVGAPAHDYRPDGLAWIQQAMFPSADDLSSPTLPVSKLGLIENTIIDACDGADGLVDDLVDNPPGCDFDPSTAFPMCPGDVDPGDNSCLTTTELNTLLRIYEESPSGTVPFPYSGCENTQGFFSWAEWMVSCSWCPFVTLTPNLQYVFAEEELRYFVYDDPTYDFRDFDVADPDQIADLDYMMEYASAMDPDLRPFRDRGGKMIMYHGWGDPIISPYNTINYYEEVENFKKNTNKKFKDVREFVRLFLAPGMLHCNGGPGPSAVDYLTALEEWVEDGNAPDSLLSSGGEVPDRTRPLCPYPEIAVWDGSGDPDDAGSFTCQEP